MKGSSIAICTILLILGSHSVFSQTVQAEQLKEGILLMEGYDSLLVYRSKGEESQGRYMRSHYVHPLYALDGEVLTEDYPADHLHHHGVFWAWHQLYIGDRRIGDGWENRDIKWEVVSLQTENDKGSASIITKVNWVSPLWLDEQENEKPVVSETTTITVHPAGKGYRLIDFEISIIANQPNTRIGGSEDPKGYGGFSPRIRLPEDIQFIGANGTVEPQTNPVESKGWLNMVGSLGKGGSLAGIAMLSHPTNPGYPNPWILRSKRSMQNAVYPHPGATPVPLSDETPTVLRYRLVIHDGLSISSINKLHQQYSKKAF